MTHSAQAYREAYEKLNPEQRRAVDTIEGPVMVVAGPGTGKTEILALRIATILRETDAGAEGVLALTFTESGARAMRARLHTYIGSDAYRVTISTFHGFAESLIREYPESFERIIGGRPLSDIERIELIEEILEGRDYKAIRPAGNPAFYVPHIQRALSKLKQENITPDGLLSIIDADRKKLALMPRLHEKGPHAGKVRGEYHALEKVIEKNEALALFYRTYMTLTKERRLYDYEDMIMETIRALSLDESMLRDLEERYLYILADEHQDVNGSQNEILSLLTKHSEAPNLFVVGDEKQAIYRFQGASLENFLYFEEAYPKTTTISLLENYRSGQTILDAAHALITAVSSAADELRVPLLAAGIKKQGTIELRAFAHEAVEEDTLADLVREKVDAGTAQKEIAVIVRTNKEVEHLTTLLRKRGLEVLPSADTDILEHPITHTIRSLVRAVTVHGEEEPVATVLGGAYWGITPDDLVRLYKARNYGHSLLALIENEALLGEAGITNIAPIMHVGEVLRGAREREGIEPPHRILEALLRESGYLDAVMERHPFEGARIVRRLYDEVEAWVRGGTAKTLRDVGRLFDRMHAHGVGLNAPFIGNQDDAVRVMTAHKSKGLEFEYVFLPHLTDALWGGKKKPEYFKIATLRHLDDDAFDRSDDERRLLYVALTRAKLGVYLSHSDSSREGRELVQTRLLSDIDPALITKVDVETAESDFDPMRVLREEEARSAHIDPVLLKGLFLERGLSVTGLNNYLSSPWDYFFRNLLRMPEYKTVPLLFGDAVHAVLQKVYDHRKNMGSFPNATQIDTMLKEALARLPITTEEYARLHERGFSALLSYCEKTTVIPESDVRCEFKLSVELQTDDPDLPLIPLTGVIDRLDLDADGRAIRFVDYKTGKHKTRNVIEGKTKGSDGAYKRQLVFYALLLSLYDRETYGTKTGVLSFVEPDAKGELHEESFTVTDAEIEALRDEIVRVAKEITSGAFLSAPCDPSVCTYCHLAKGFEGR